MGVALTPDLATNVVYCGTQTVYGQAKEEDRCRST